MIAWVCTLFAAETGTERLARKAEPEVIKDARAGLRRLVLASLDSAEILERFKVERARLRPSESDEVHQRKHGKP